MTTSIEEKNVQIVLDAFDVLFNKRDYAAAEHSGRRTTSSIARIFRRAAKDSSSLSELCPPRCVTRTTWWPHPATSSFSMGV